MNIVFDLGGVVFNWDPDRAISSVFSDPEKQRLAREHIFDHSDWVALDRGTLELAQAITRGVARSGLARNDVSSLMAAVPLSLTPISDTVDLLLSVSDTDNRLFVLSNMHVAAIAHLERANSFWHVFEGVVISCRIKKVKPEPAIYQYLLDEHSLVPAETVFIDDVDENLVAASAFGIGTIKFHDASQCARDLGALGYI